MPENYTVDWTSQHAELWERVLGEFVGKLNVQALEIGAYEGRSSAWFMDHILTGSGSQLTCVDPWVAERLPADIAEALFHANTALYGDRVQKVKSRSLPFLLHCAGGGARYDWIYVDGDHRAHSCLTDMVLAWQLLHDGGVMLVDDTGPEYSAHWRRGSCYPPPRVAADAFLQSFDGTYRLLHNGDQVVVKKSISSHITYVTRPPTYAQRPDDYVAGPGDMTKRAVHQPDIGQILSDAIIRDGAQE
jgi:hypothetical protein